MRLCCLALQLVLPACGDSPTGADQPPTFHATVTGSVSATLSRGAAAGANSATGGWGVAMAPGSAQSITFLTPGNDRPPPGPYPIVVFIQDGSATGTVCVAFIVAEPGGSSYVDGGAMTIESSFASRVSGAFSFQAERSTVANSSAVDVMGTFDATNAPRGM
jgi:hypothetical protein